MTIRVHRYSDATSLGLGVASFLARRLAGQRSGFKLCLSDGLGDVCAALGQKLADAGVRPRHVDLWWSDDRFVEMTDPARVSTKTLAALGGVRFTAGNVHPMPAVSGNIDVAAAAVQYATELAGTAFDLAILTVADDGGVAGLRPGSPAFTHPDAHTVVGVREHGLDRLTLTTEALDRSAALWFVASGEAVSTALARAVADDDALPAGLLRGRVETRLFVDEEAAGLLPYHVCEV